MCYSIIDTLPSTGNSIVDNAPLVVPKEVHTLVFGKDRMIRINEASCVCGKHVEIKRAEVA